MRKYLSPEPTRVTDVLLSIHWELILLQLIKPLDHQARWKCTRSIRETDSEDQRCGMARLCVCEDQIGARGF